MEDLPNKIIHKIIGGHKKSHKVEKDEDSEDMLMGHFVNTPRVNVGHSKNITQPRAPETQRTYGGYNANRMRR